MTELQKILGVYFECKVCDGFPLCFKCYNHKDSIHTSHEFIDRGYDSDSDDEDDDRQSASNWESGRSRTSRPVAGGAGGISGSRKAASTVGASGIRGTADGTLVEGEGEGEESTSSFDSEEISDDDSTEESRPGEGSADKDEKM